MHITHQNAVQRGRNSCVQVQTYHPASSKQNYRTNSKEFAGHSSKRRTTLFTQKMRFTHFHLTLCEHMLVIRGDYHVEVSLSSFSTVLTTGGTLDHHLNVLRLRTYRVSATLVCKLMAYLEYVLCSTWAVEPPTESARIVVFGYFRTVKSHTMHKCLSTEVRTTQILQII